MISWLKVRVSGKNQKIAEWSVSYLGKKLKVEMKISFFSPECPSGGWFPWMLADGADY